MRHSRAKKVIWNHNDVADLEAKLAAADPNAPKIVAFESVYSMDGDIAPIEAICDVADKYGAMTYLEVAAGALASIQHLRQSNIERMRQRKQVATLRKRLDDLGIPHIANPSHIVPVMIGDAAKCKMLSDILLDEYGVYVQPINYPTVPKGTERLRFTPSPLHSDADIEHLVQALGTLWSQCALSRAVA